MAQKSPDSSDAMNLENAKKIFFEESAENLQRLEENLLVLEENSHDPEFVNALFREVHTIKGSAGMFGYTEISGFAHIFENMLDLVRKNSLEVTNDLVQVSLKAHDYLRDILELFLNEHALTDEITQRGSDVIEQINALTSSAGVKVDVPKTENSPAAQDEANTEKNIPPQSQSEQSQKDDPDVVANSYWHISLRFSQQVFKNGLDPYSFISYLKNKGTIVSVITVTSALPDLDAYDPEQCYLGFEIDFDGDDNIERKDILGVFEFVADDCKIVILPPRSQIARYVQMIRDLPEAPDRLGDLLVASGTLTQMELSRALSMQHEQSVQPHALGEVLIGENILAKPVIEAALEKQKEIRQHEDKGRSSIRIDAYKIDSLISLVGELVINSANIKELSEKSSDQVLVEAVSTMVRLVDDIRDSTMNIRMVPIGETFGTFRRTVHDLSKELGKEIDLEIIGGDTELDKTIVEKIHEPLMHLVRNVIDHGIEIPDERIVRGKPAKGTLTLNAFHESGSIVIEVKDDGQGLSREKIYAKAVEKGLLNAGTQISDSDLFMMVTQPGFSTAEKVTNISGRGVGMDVVRKNVESLRGTLDIESTANVGSIFRVHLPLTLAIIDGFLVKVGGLSYVFPLDMVIECTDIDEAMLKNEGGDFFSLRGEALPYLRVAEFFGLQGGASGPANRKHKENMVIVEYAHKRAGLIVDELVGKYQTVIKPLGKLFAKLMWISGATIVGNGDVAMIIDVPRLITRVREYAHNTVKSA